MPPNDILGALGATADEQGALVPPAPAAVTSGADPAVLRILGEAGGDVEGQRAVASTIANRVKAGMAKTPQALVVDPRGGYNDPAAPSFDALQTKYPTNSPAYQAAAANVGGILSGQVAPPYPYDSYYSPKGQVALGRKPPQWDDGSGVNIGGNLFFAGKAAGGASAAQDPLDALGITPEEKAALAAQTPPAPITPGGKTQGTNANLLAGGEHMTAAQEKFFNTNNATRHFNDTDPEGSATNPMYQAPGGAIPQTPGAHWVDADGTEHIVAGGLAEKAAGAGAGLLQGLGADTAASASRLTGGGIGVPSAEGGMGGMGTALAQTFGNQDVGAQAKAVQQGVAQQQRDYQIQHGNNAFAQGGRFVGQMVPSTAAALAVPELEAPEVAGSAFANTALRGGAKVATNALRGTAASAANVGANPNVPVGQQLATGGLAGVVASAVPKAAEAVGERLGMASVNAGNIPPDMTGLAQTAIQKYGIPIRASQIAGTVDRNMAYRDSNLIQASPAFARNNQQQIAAWNQAVLREAGAPPGSTGATPAVMDAARKANGAMFEDVASRNAIRDPDAVMGRLGQVVHDAQMVLPESEVQPLLKQVENIGSTRQGDEISGQSYLALTKAGSPLDRLSRSEGNAAFYAQQMRGILDDGLKEGMTTDDAAKLDQARAQWKAMKTIEPMAEKAGPDGLMSPRLLLGRMMANPYNGDLAYTGGGNMGELAKIGSTLMKEPPQSGTAPRMVDVLKRNAVPNLIGLGAVAGEATTGALGHLVNDPGLALQLGIAGAATKGAQAVKNALTGIQLGPGAGKALVGAPGATRSAFEGLKKVGRPLEVPLSALGSLRLLNAPSNPQSAPAAP